MTRGIVGGVVDTAPEECVFSILVEGAMADDAI